MPQKIVPVIRDRGCMFAGGIVRVVCIILGLMAILSHALLLVSNVPVDALVVYGVLDISVPMRIRLVKERQDSRSAVVV